MKYSPEEIKLAMSCTSPEELLEKATAAGHALTPGAAHAAFDTLHGCGEVSDDALDAISGGGCFFVPDFKCPLCGRHDSLHYNADLADVYCDGCDKHFAAEQAKNQI